MGYGSCGWDWSRRFAFTPEINIALLRFIFRFDILPQPPLQHQPIAPTFVGSPSKRPGRDDLTTASLRRTVRTPARLPPLRYHQLGLDLALHIRLRPRIVIFDSCETALRAFQIVGGHFGNNICVHSNAVLFVQEISVLKECKFIFEIAKEQPVRPSRRHPGKLFYGIKNGLRVSTFDVDYYYSAEYVSTCQIKLSHSSAH